MGIKVVGEQRKMLTGKGGPNNKTVKRRQDAGRKKRGEREGRAGVGRFPRRRGRWKRG